jgi:hypothetical protein
MEAELGYRVHRRLELAHLAEAENELIKEFPDWATKVRTHRLLYRSSWKGERYHIPYMEMLTDLDNLAEVLNLPLLVDAPFNDPRKPA